MVLGAVIVWAAMWGCADPRHQPTTAAQPGYTETINLWSNSATDANGVAAAPFSVAQQLAPINVPGQDSPARLTVAAYIVPDCQIYRRLQIMQDSIPYVRDSLIIRTLVTLTDLKTAVTNADTTVTRPLDSLEGVLRGLTGSLRVIVSPTDSLAQFTYHGHTTQCDSALHLIVPDPAIAAHEDSVLASVNAAIVAINDTLGRLAGLEIQYAQLVLDTTRLGQELVYLNTLLDTRYVLSVALDSTGAFYIPNATYSDSVGHIAGQGIYSAVIDTSIGMIGRGFTLPLDRLEAADITHLGHTFEVNWAVCFPGSSSPCLSPGSHTIYVRIPGRNARVTGTIVLVYAERT